MRDWQEHWSSFPARFAPTDYLRQVGKTVGGRPIRADQVEWILADIRRGLAPAPGDAVLDLCCGNGLLTRRISDWCARVVGIDYSPLLLGVAQQHQRSNNLSYVCGSVLDLESLPLPEGARFNKILMYEALQHFEHDELHGLLEAALSLATDDCRLFIGSIPDRERIWCFYDTPRRKLDCVVRRCLGGDAIGSWWDREFLARTCATFGLSCAFREQSLGLHTAHYRFDLLAAAGPSGRAGA
jgi:2-polyprenyl-3-methyl-5-hydroxy-6-metoxy-1,4-benzoquinol methylase